MDDKIFYFLVFIGFSITAIVVIYRIINDNKKTKIRKEQLLNFASKNGYQYCYEDLFNITSTYRLFEILTKGYSQEQPTLLPLAQNCNTTNVISGIRDNKTFKIFDYKYTERRGRETYTIEFSAIIVDLPGFFPPLVIRPESFKDKVASSIGFDDINFESEIFNQTFFVKSPDKKFAYDVINPKMMEHLIMNKNWHIEIQFNSIMIYKNGSLNRIFEPCEIESNLNFIYTFLNMIPDYVWTDHIANKK